MENIWHSWIIVALAVPILYALDSVLDVFFVDRKIFRDPVHATILSGLFSVIYLLGLLLEYKQFELPQINILIICIANGMFYIAHVYFYFKVLFSLNDASNLECFLGFSVILVPAFAFFFLGDKLTSLQLLGIGISLIGVIWLFVINVSRSVFKESFLTMTYTVTILSLTFIIQDKMYQHVNFYTGLILFLSGQLLASLIIWKATGCSISAKKTIKYGPLFFISQMLGVAAVIFSQRAINISPSVTIVVAIETTTPLFIMLFSFIAIFVLSLFSEKNSTSIQIFKLQLTKLSYKVFAFVCLLTGVILTSSPDAVKRYMDNNFHSIASTFN